MKRFLLVLFACLWVVVGMTSCRMRYAGHNARTLAPRNGAYRTHRHFGARQTVKPRMHIWGRKHYGPRPYRHRGRYRY